MKPHTKRLIKATLVAPWSVIAVSTIYALYRMAQWIGKDLPDPGITLIWPDPFKPWEYVALFSLYGIPTAYVLLLVVGLPFYFIAQKLDLLSYVSAVSASILACFPAAFFYGRGYDFTRTFLFLIPYAITISTVFYAFTKEKTGQPNQVEASEGNRRSASA